MEKYPKEEITAQFLDTKNSGIGNIEVCSTPADEKMDDLVKQTATLGREKNIITWANRFLSFFCAGTLACFFEIIKEPTNIFWILLIIFIILSALCVTLIFVYKDQENTNIKQFRSNIESIIKNTKNYSIDPSYLCGDKKSIDWERVYKRCVMKKEPLRKEISVIILFLTLPSLALAMPTAQVLKTNDYFMSILAVLTIIIALYICFKSLKRERKIKHAYNELEEKYFRLKHKENTITILDETTPGQSHVSNYKEEILTRAKELLQTGSIEAAINLISKAIAHSPKQYQYYEYRGDAYAQLGNTDLAIMDYTEAILLTNKEESFRIFHKRAIIQNNMGNFMGAEANYIQALEILTKQEESHKVPLDDTEVINMLNDYGNFLLRLNKLSEAERIFSIAMDKCHQSSDSNNAQELLAMTLNNSSLLHKKIYQLDKAEDEAKRAHKKYRILAANSPEKHLPDVAMSLNNLANIHADINNLVVAEEEYTEALSIRRQLAEANPDAYLPDVATTLNNLAILHADTNKYADAEEEYTEALITYRQLAKSNPDAFLPYVATTLNNLAILHSDTNKHAAAEEEYTEALSTYRSLAEANPDAFLPDVVMTLNNLANLHAVNNNHAAAEEEYTEALSTYRSLAEANPGTFLPDVATTLNNLASLHADTNNHAAAEEEYTEALSIRRQIARKNPDTFLPDVASTLNNLATLHRDTNNHAAAEEEYTEALSIRRQIARKNPDAFLPDVASTLNNLATLHRDTNNHAAAEKEYSEAQFIRLQLAKTIPNTYQHLVTPSLKNVHSDHYSVEDAVASAIQEGHAVIEETQAKQHEELSEIVRRWREHGGD